MANDPEKQRKQDLLYLKGDVEELEECLQSENAGESREEIGYRVSALQAQLNALLEDDKQDKMELAKISIRLSTASADWCKLFVDERRKMKEKTQAETEHLKEIVANTKDDLAENPSNAPHCSRSDAATGNAPETHELPVEENAQECLSTAEVDFPKPFHNQVVKTKKSLKRPAQLQDVFDQFDKELEERGKFSEDGSKELEKSLLAEDPKKQKRGQHISRSASAAETRLPPSTIRYAQKNIKGAFGRGSSLTRTFKDLLERKLTPDDIETIDVVKSEGSWWAVSGNRRLCLFKHLEELGLVDSIPVVIRDLSDPDVKERFRMRFTTETNGQSIQIRTPGVEAELQRMIVLWKGDNTIEGAEQVNLPNTEPADELLTDPHVVHEQFLAPVDLDPYDDSDLDG